MTPSKIIVHCTATDNGKSVPIEEIRKWHLSKGFKDIGYHLVIQPDGQVQRGRGLNEEGAHCQGENHCSIGICLVGRDKYTKAQFQALERQIDSILLTYNAIPHYAIYCHYQFESAQKQKKTCPNMEVNRLLVWYHLKEDSAIKQYLL
jgi:N-acetylmuramoyl-L-alanine amidase